MPVAAGRSTRLTAVTFGSNKDHGNEEQVKRLGLIAALALTFVGLSAGAALAVTNFANAPSGAHYRQGSAEPVCTETTVPTTGAVTVSCTTTTIGGVGNTNANLLLDVTGTANFVCHNPG